jgi:hypothetical protein
VLLGILSIILPGPWLVNKIADGEEIENRDIVIRPSEPLPLAAFGGEKRKGVVIKKGMEFPT